MVQVRTGHSVFLTVDRLRADRPPLVQSSTHGIFVYGRYEDEILQTRFATLCKLARSSYGATIDGELRRLREIAHVLRRSMKPKHDDQTVLLREEGH